MNRDTKTVRTHCSRMDEGGCGLAVTTRDGRIVNIEGDSECSLSRGFICARARALPEIIYHPDRLIYPQINKGTRDEGKWEKVSWDNALTQIAEKLVNIKEKYGPQSIAFSLGTPKGLELAFTHRFASILGTPNIATPGNVCHMPREQGAILTYGTPLQPDYKNNPACIVVWGSNALETNSGALPGSQVFLKQAIDKGSILVVVDPRKSWYANRAKLWLKIRPGTDGLLAIAMIKSIIEEHWYDEGFVNGYCEGFDELKAIVSRFSFDWLENMTWISAEEIKKAAEIYSLNKPSAIQLGNAIDHTADSLQSCRAVAILRAITGNIDIKGGEYIPETLNLLRPGDFMLLRERKGWKVKPVGEEFKIATRLSMVPRQLLVKAILNGKPYPIKALLSFGSNPVLSYANSPEVMKSLSQLELLVVSDFFMTPTASAADFVLPAATCFEFDEIGHYGNRYGYLLAHAKVIEPQGECKPDMEIINNLAIKMGMGQYFWKDTREALDYILKPYGITFEELKSRTELLSPVEYIKYEKSGFQTPTGKVEIYSKALAELGYEPIPFYGRTIAELERKYAVGTDFPFILTSLKSNSYFHSAYRNVPSLRKMMPNPVVRINSHTASSLGIKQGDWVNIETPNGKIKQQVLLDNEIDQRLVIASYGWWYPEKGGRENYGWQESNINILTSSEPPYEPAIGSLNLRGIPCRILKP